MADERVPFEHEKRIEIRWRDLDAFGHVNHVVFLTHLEESRDEWLGGRLGDPDRVWDWVVAHVEVDYRRELALADDTVIATCRLARIGRSSVSTHEEVRTAAGLLAAEASAVLVTVTATRGARARSRRPSAPRSSASLSRTGCGR